MAKINKNLWPPYFEIRPLTLNALAPALTKIKYSTDSHLTGLLKWKIIYYITEILNLVCLFQMQ